MNDMLKIIVSGMLALICMRQDNEAPAVRLVSPGNTAQAKWNTPLRFEVHVVDKEDGDSKYSEIDAAQVLVQAIVTMDTLQLNHTRDVAPLRNMMASNCMNCHAFDARLIGPSFKQISERYAHVNDVTTLVKHVREGSRGIWGDVVMPTHPELSADETQRMVQWILDFGKDDAVSYAIGTEGMLRMKKPSAVATKAFVLVTASYRDKNGAVGEDRRVLNIIE
jgi:cytochrome c